MNVLIEENKNILKNQIEDDEDEENSYEELDFETSGLDIDKIWENAAGINKTPFKW